MKNNKTQSGQTVPLDSLGGRAPGYVQHTDGCNGHRIVSTGNGDEHCTSQNCEINQPCDAESMRRLRTDNNSSATNETQQESTP